MSANETPEEAAWRAAVHEINEHYPAFAFEHARLQEAGFRPTGVVIPSRLNVPRPNFDDGGDMTRPAFYCGLRVTWGDDDDWGFILHIPQPRKEQS